MYVTKDKRLKSRWRKRLVWAIGLALCAAILIIGFLAASKCWNILFKSFVFLTVFSYLFSCVGGVFGSDTEPIESRQFKDKDNKINTAGVFSGSGRRNNETKYSATPQTLGSTVPSLPPTTDENLVYGNFDHIFVIHLN